MATIEIRTRYLKSIRVGELQAKFSADGTRILRYFIDFWHNDLDLHKELSAPEIYILQGKVDALMAAWDKKLVEHQYRSKVTAGKDLADQMTIEAGAKLDALANILKDTLKVDDRVDWDSLKDFTDHVGIGPFQEAKPNWKPTAEPNFREPEISFWDKILGRKNQRIAEANLSHEKALTDWKQRQVSAETSHRSALAAWANRKADFEHRFAEDKAQFEAIQASRNAKVDALAAGVQSGNPESVIEHASIVLESSDYNDLFEKSLEIDYSPADKTLMIEYDLPSPDRMPMLKTARFVPATGEIRETYISDREQRANFDSACYQICLRTIHEVLEADEHGNIEQVLFNGFTTYVDKATGRDTTTCIMSILVDRADFLSIDLYRADPKSCSRV